MANVRAYGPMVLICVVGVSACVDIPKDSSTDRVSAAFDPDASVLPLPNSAALDRDGTLPDLGGEAAQGEFHKWLSKSYGWDPSTPISIPFAGKLDADSVSNGDVKLYRVSAEGVFEELDATLAYAENQNGESPVCNPTACASVIRVVPTAPLVSGETYAAVATTDILGANGETILPSTAMFFAASPTPLVDANGKSQISSLDGGKARDLEGLRQLLQPVFAHVESQGGSRDKVAAATLWSTSLNAFSVLDPATATLPIPNTLALDADGTFPRAALGYCGPAATPVACDADSDCGVGLCQSGTCVTTRCAQATFDTYLDGLHGWPTTTPITLPTSGPVDGATVNSNTLRLFKVTEAGLEEVSGELTYEEGAKIITMTTLMELNTRYVAIATQDINSTTADAAGNPLPLLPAPGIAMAIQPFPIVDESGRSLIEEIPSETAASIAFAQSFMRPLAEAVEAKTGISHDKLAALWTWQTWSDTFVVFDPTTARLPFPSAFVAVDCPPDRPICGLYDPANPPTDPLQNAIFDEVSKRDGFSTTATNWVPTEGPPLDPATVTVDNVLIAEAETALPTLVDPADYAVNYEYGHVLLDLKRPLKSGILVAGVATTGLMGSNGFPAQPSGAFVFLRSEFPLVDASGKSLINVLDDATAVQLEGARQAYSQLWLAAQLFGYSRTEVVSAWAYTTGTPTLPLQELRAQAMTLLGERTQLVAHRACEPDCATDPGLIGPLSGTATYQHPDDPTWDVDLSAVDFLQFDGEIESVSVLNAMRRIQPFADFTEPRIGISVAVPKARQGCAAPFDVAIVQHGLGGYRKGMILAMANSFAERCIATVAIDLPLHGGRIPGAATLHPSSYPTGSGDGFLTGDLLASANNLMQAVVDLSVVTQFVKDGALDTLIGQSVSDSTSKIGYVGISMGGFAGTLLSTVDPAIEASVLNVTGGNYAIVLTQSESFMSLLTDAGILGGSFAFIQTLHFLQWLGEKVDPYAFAPSLIASPLKDKTFDAADGTFADGVQMESRDVLVQMVAGDPTIPNTSTELLANTLGVSLDESTYEDTTHGFLGDGTSAQSTCARDQAAEWIGSSFLGNASIPANLVAQTCVAARSN